MKEILSLNLHVGQFVSGQMCTNVNADKHKVVMTLTPVGVEIIGSQTDKIIPFSNIQGIDYRLPEAK